MGYVFGPGMRWSFVRGERQGVVAGVEDEDDDPVATRARFAGEAGAGVFDRRLVDAGREMPEALAGGRRDQGGDVEPLEAVVAAGDRAPRGARARRRTGFSAMSPAIGRDRRGCSSMAKAGVKGPRKRHPEADDRKESAATRRTSGAGWISGRGMRKRADIIVERPRDSVRSGAGLPRLGRSIALLGGADLGLIRAFPIGPGALDVAEHGADLVVAQHAA